MALVTLYLPPTQSQNPKTLYSFIPNFPVSTKFVDTAVKWDSSISLHKNKYILFHLYDQVIYITLISNFYKL